MSQYLQEQSGGNGSRQAKSCAVARTDFKPMCNSMKSLLPGWSGRVAKRSNRSEWSLITSWLEERSTNSEGWLPAARSACCEFRVVPGGRFPRRRKSVFRSAQPSAFPLFHPLVTQPPLRGPMRRAGNQKRTNKRVYLLNKASCRDASEPLSMLHASHNRRRFDHVSTSWKRGFKIDETLAYCRRSPIARIDVSNVSRRPNLLFISSIMLDPTIRCYCRVSRRENLRIVAKLLETFWPIQVLDQENISTFTMWSFYVHPAIYVKRYFIRFLRRLNALKTFKHCIRSWGWSERFGQ